MSEIDRSSVSSQDAKVHFDPTASPEDWEQSVNDALGLIRDDVQRQNSASSVRKTTAISCSGYRATMPSSGVANVWAVSDTASAGSTGAAYHTLTLRRNGSAIGTLTYDTRRIEIPAYRGGAYIGKTKVAASDVLSVGVSVTGAPAPTLSTANFVLFCTLTES